MKYSNQSNFRELPSTIQHPALTKRRVLEICKKLWLEKIKKYSPKGGCLKW